MLESAGMKKGEAGSWQRQRICGWFKEVGRMVLHGRCFA